MPVHQWELRADVRPLDEAAVRWSEIGQLMSQRADDLVDAARHALDGWEAAAADSYDDHRRQVVANLDLFTTLAGQVAGSLRALSSMITETQKELDQAWVNVSLVPHRVVGPDRRLVFEENGDEDRAKVAGCELEANEIRRRLAGALDQESTRLRTARAELMQVRASLVDLAGGGFPSLLRSGIKESGVGIIGPAYSTSVVGSAESGVSVGLAPIGPISVSVPHLSGLATSSLAPIIGVAASGTAGQNGSGRGRLQGDGMPMGGGMAAGAARGASSLRGGGGGRRTGGGSGSLATPKLTAEDEAARSARERAAAKDSAKEAKRAELAEKRAARAARKAEQDAERGSDSREEAAVEVDENVEVAGAPPANLTVVEVAPGEQPKDSRL